jgi:acyl transferase domain-containing protein/NAD(P)-dependent dehydrogenase (short-subunit alcohol dehydrogenase family)/acyl carrier protein
MAANEFLDRLNRLSPKQLALLALELQQKLERQTQNAPGPIAVIGMGCRLPGGVTTPAAYWSLLAQGRDAITEIPADRWDVDAYYDPDPDAPGKVATRWGGFIDGVDQFDPDFFGIAPREAINMDPQQRLVLEVAWEALEHAGIAPDSLEKSRTGVFLGICNSDYFQLNSSGDPRHIDAYLASGSAASVASGRLSYLLGLQGPSISVDTACSSSLVSVHLACQSLRSGESKLAIAGGVNLILRPEVTMTLSRAHMMASDGRCKAFDSRADGFVRAEGCGLVVLKRLADAQADGDDILAVIRASASNQDGRSSGITAPNGPAQEAVIRDALAAAGLQPADIDYVEAHGTGTSLGDPIEIQALASALGTGRDAETALLVGSVKTNIGHLESAAGVAGLIKVILALNHRLIPPHLHLRELNSHIEWRGKPIEVPTRLTPWRSRGVRLAGVSSFGFSGTNAHLIVEEAPTQPERTGAIAAPTSWLLPLSARSDAALAELAQQLARHIAAHPDEDVGAMCARMGRGRAHFEHRLAVFGSTRQAIADALTRAAMSETPPGVVRGTANITPEIAFLFSGQGSQYAGMGRELYETEPVFRQVIDECERAVVGLLDKPLKQVLFESDRTELAQTANLQPALFALEVGLAALWRSWGITPTVVVGHSLGEYSAACVAGMFSVADGVRLVAARGRLMQRANGEGRMIAVHADESIVRALIKQRSGVAIAAMNAPNQIVISGYAKAVDDVAGLLMERGCDVHALDVSHGFHSPQMDEILAEFEREARTVVYRAPQIELIANLTGEAWTSGTHGDDPAKYWTRHVREPVQFQRCMQTLNSHGVRIFLEIGPNPVLLGMARLSAVSPDQAEWLPSLRTGTAERNQLLQCLGRLYAAGARIDWSAVTRGAHRGLQHALPTYPFQRRRFWISPKTQQHRPMSAKTPHVLTGSRLDTATPTFETTLDLQSLSYLDQHRIGGRAVAPGALLLQLLRAAAQEVFDGQEVLVHDVAFREMLVVPESEHCRVQVVFTDTTPDGFRVSIYSRDAQDAESSWKLHVTGQVSRATAAPRAPIVFSTAMKQCGESASPDEFYAQLSQRSLDFGPLFRGITEVRSDGDGHVLGKVRLSESLRGDNAHIHPVLLDACLQLVGVAVARRGGNETYMQVSLERMHLAQTTSTELWGYAALREEAGEPLGDVFLYDDRGLVVGSLQGIGLKRVPLALLTNVSAAPPHPEWLYEVAWRRPASSQAGWALPSLNVIAQPLRASIAALSREHGLDAFAELSPQMERASSLFIARALERMDCRLPRGSRVTTDTLRRDCRVLPSHERLFARMLAVLAEEGVLRQSGREAWEVLSGLPSGDGSAECERLLKSYPDYRAELSLLARCGARLAEVLQGSQDPLQLLFPDGDPAALEGLYRDSPSARVFNRVVQNAAAALAAHGLKGRKLRVLEIGGGTASTTQYVLPSVPPETEYVFTDISPLFVARAAELFAKRKSMEFRVFDVDDKTAVEQGLTPGSFDLIIAANVLHATRELRRTVGRVHELLRPGGVLLLLEGTRALRWVDLTFGMTEGWWRFSDRDLRPQHALLAPAQWRDVLASSGFDQTTAVPEEVEAAGQSVLLARRALAETQSPLAAKQQRFLICSRDPNAARSAASACAALNIDAIVAIAGVGQKLRSNEHSIGGAATSQIVPALIEIIGSCGPFAGIVLLAAESGAEDPVARTTADCLLATALLKGILAAPEGSRLWIVTRGAQPVGGSLGRFEQAALWGMGRVAALEHPERFGGLLDMDPRAESFDAASLSDAIAHAGAEDQIAVRDGETHVARLVRSSLAHARGFVWRDDRTYLITGWMGGLGLLLVQWLAERGVRHMVLVGRRDPDAGGANTGEAKALLQNLRARGVELMVVVGDVADRTTIEPLFQRFGSDVPQLAGVFHVAAQLDSCPLATLEPAAWQGMMYPKASGAWVLHELTAKLDLDCFVLFSSTTALWGAQGLAHYAAANQFLDGLAHERHAAGLPALSVNWGTWDVMRLATAEAQELYASAGLQRMSAPGALAMLESALAAAVPATAIAGVDWELLKPIYEARRVRPFFAEVGAAPERRTKHASKEERLDETWRFDDVSDNHRREALAERVREEIASVLGLSGAPEVDPNRGLFDMGMDSLMAVELRARLQKRAGRALPSTLTFNYPTAAALSQFLEQLLLIVPAKPPETAYSAATPVPYVRSEVDTEDLSEDELEQLLAERLKAL